MKVSRTTRLFRGQLDLAPFLCVMFPLAFVALFSGFLVLPRGARLVLPTVAMAPAIAPGEAALIVAVDSARRCYFENQIISLPALETALARRIAEPGAPSTLLIEADAAVPFGQLAELAVLARRSGVRQAVFGALPPPAMTRVVAAPEPGWSRWRWGLVTCLVAALQTGAVLWVTRWPALPTPGTAASPDLVLRLASMPPDSGDAELWSGDPRQFALPDHAGFSGLARRALPALEYRLAEWSGDPRWLNASTDPTRLGTVPPLTVSPPGRRPSHVGTIPAGGPEAPLLLKRESAASLRGELAGRAFTAESQLPSAAGADVLAATVIELAVSPGGAVLWTRLVTGSGSREADLQGLGWARTLQFDPQGPEISPGAGDPADAVSGELVVVWHVTPSVR